MSDPEVHGAITRFGFEFGWLTAERIWSQKGAVCLRVRNRRTGEYIDITATASGYKTHINNGRIKVGEL